METAEPLLILTLPKKRWQVKQEHHWVVYLILVSLLSQRKEMGYPIFSDPQSQPLCKV